MLCILSLIATAALRVCCRMEHTCAQMVSAGTVDCGLLDPLTRINSGIPDGCCSGTGTSSLPWCSATDICPTNAMGYTPDATAGAVCWTDSSKQSYRYNTWDPTCASCAGSMSGSTTEGECNSNGGVWESISCASIASSPQHLACGDLDSMAVQAGFSQGCCGGTSTSTGSEGGASGGATCLNIPATTPSNKWATFYGGNPFGCQTPS